MLLRETPWWVYAVTFFGALQWILFARSSQITETAVTTIIFESWPILVIIGRWKFKTANNKKRATFVDAILVAAAGIGLAVVISSEQIPGNNSFSSAGIIFAVLGLIAVAASIIATLSGGEITAERLEAHTIQQTSAPQAALRTRASTLPRAIMWISAGFGLLSFAVLSSDIFSVEALMVGASLGFLHGLASLSFTHANHLSNSDTINSLYYLVPVLALGWLWIFTDITVANPELFVAGAAGLVVINFVIHFRSRITARVGPLSARPAKAMSSS